MDLGYGYGIELTRMMRLRMNIVVVDISSFRQIRACVEIALQFVDLSTQNVTKRFNFRQFLLQLAMVTTAVTEGPFRCVRG